MRFSDKVILITGAAQGIGECTAKRFAKEGGTVVLTDIEGSLASQVSKSINADGGKSISFRLDVCSQNEINAVVKECIKKFGKIDILVHSAGVYKEAPFLSMSEEEWDETLNVNWEKKEVGSFFGVSSEVITEDDEIQDDSDIDWEDEENFHDEYGCIEEDDYEDEYPEDEDLAIVTLAEYITEDETNGNPYCFIEWAGDNNDGWLEVWYGCEISINDIEIYK